MSKRNEDHFTAYAAAPGTRNFSSFIDDGFQYCEYHCGNRVFQPGNFRAAGSRLGAVADRFLTVFVPVNVSAVRNKNILVLKKHAD